MVEPAAKKPYVVSSRELREVFVIALGILLAFGVDASWTEFREGVQLREHLAAVDAELAQNIEALQEVEREAEAVAEASAALLAMAGPNAVAELPDSIAMLIGTIWFPVRASTSQGALEALRASGLLAEVSDPDLRQSLAAWPARLQGPQPLIDVADQRMQQVISPLLHQYVSEVDLNRSSGFATRTHLRGQYREMVAASTFESDYTGLLRDRRLESLLGQRVALTLLLADIAAEVQEGARQIRTLIAVQ